MTDITERLLFLEWDSNFFGKRIARLHGSTLDPESLPRIDAWCRQNRINCLYFLADPDDDLAIRTAEGGCFNLVDVRITLDKKLLHSPDVPWQPTCHDIRLASASDVDDLRATAAVGHTDSRFYHDPRFPRERCDELYAVWIERSCNGYADAVLVTDANGHAASYLSCHLRADGVGQIGLVGVSSAYQGRGIGLQLVEESLRWFASAGVRQVEVVTQGRNIAAQRLYQKCGFFTRAMELWYHKWFNR